MSVRADLAAARREYVWSDVLLQFVLFLSDFLLWNVKKIAVTLFQDTIRWGHCLATQTQGFAKLLRRLLDKHVLRTSRFFYSHQTVNDTFAIEIRLSKSQPHGLPQRNCIVAEVHRSRLIATNSLCKHFIPATHGNSVIFFVQDCDLGVLSRRMHVETSGDPPHCGSETNLWSYLDLSLLSCPLLGHRWLEIPVSPFRIFKAWTCLAFFFRLPILNVWPFVPFNDDNVVQVYRRNSIKRRKNTLRWVRSQTFFPFQIFGTIPFCWNPSSYI